MLWDILLEGPSPIVFMRSLALILLRTKLLLLLYVSIQLRNVSAVCSTRCLCLTSLLSPVGLPPML